MRNRRRRPRRRRRKDSPLSRQASPKWIESRGERRSPPRRAACEGQREQNRLRTSLQSTACRLPGRRRRRSSKATPTLSASGIEPHVCTTGSHASGQAGRRTGPQDGGVTINDPVASRAARPRSTRPRPGNRGTSTRARGCVPRPRGDEAAIYCWPESQACRGRGSARAKRHTRSGRRTGQTGQPTGRSATTSSNREVWRLWPRAVRRPGEGAGVT